MVKKRTRDPEVLPEASSIPNQDEDSGSDTDMDTVNVDFEWFNFKPETDFHGLKSLLRQLLDVDAQLFDLSALADLILSQPTIGSTVKVDGEDTDAYAFMSALNVREHKDKKVVADLTEYILAKAGPEMEAGLREAMEKGELGLVLTERLINCPPQIAPPMYTWLMDEIESAVDDKEPYEFSHYLVLSKTYHEIDSALDTEDAPRSKKSKAGGKSAKEVMFFHPEDEVLQRFALAKSEYEYTKDEGEGMADSKRAFQEAGIKAQGLMVLIEAGKFEGAVKAVGEYLNPQ